MLEHHRQPLLPGPAFRLRVIRHAGVALAVVSVALSIGVLGYHLLERMPWIDALLNASMILGGMGPVGELHSAPAKLFASFYALFSGLVFIAVAGILFVPVIHRLLHRFHLETGRETTGK